MKCWDGSLCFQMLVVLRDLLAGTASVVFSFGS